MPNSGCAMANPVHPRTTPLQWKLRQFRSQLDGVLRSFIKKNKKWYYSVCPTYNKSYRKYHPNIFFKAEILSFLFVKAFHLNKWLGRSGLPLQPTSSSKGQLNSELQRFLPYQTNKDHCQKSAYTHQKKCYDPCLFGRADILVIFGLHFGRNDELLNSFWV